MSQMDYGQKCAHSHSCCRFCNFSERTEQNRKRQNRKIQNGKRKQRFTKTQVNKQQSSERLQVYLIAHPTVRASFMGLWSVQSHRISDWKGPTLGLRLCCCCLEIFKSFLTRSSTFSFCTGPCKLCSSQSFYYRTRTIAYSLSNCMLCKDHC